MILGIAIYFWIPALMLLGLLLKNVSMAIETGFRKFRGEEPKPLLLTLGLEMLLVVVMGLTSALNEYTPRIVISILVVAVSAAAVFLSYWLFEPIVWTTFHFLRGIRAICKSGDSGVKRNGGE